MRRWGAWSRCSGNDAVAVWKRAESRLKCGYANVLPMIRTGLYRLPTFCGWDVDASQCRTNSRQDSFRYHSITLAWTGHRVLQQYTGCVTEIFPEHHVSDLGPSVPGSYATMPSNSWPRGEVIDGRAPAR